MTTRLRIFISTTDALCERMDLLALDELQRAHSMVSERRRKQFCAGRALLRLALSDGNNRPPAEWPIRLHDNRPLLDGADAPRFSLSHSGDHVGCAISHGQRCGFDLEALNPKPRHAIANEFFADEDARWLATQPDFSSAFHRLWVLKESWAKASGTPLLHALAHARWCADKAVTALWHGGTAALSDTLTAGWAIEHSITTVELNEWQGAGFAPLATHWTRWTLHTAPDSSRCGT